MGDKGLAIVTGAGRGIGACVAAGLAEDGHRVVLISRDAEKLETIAGTIASRFPVAPRPVVLPADITRHEELSEKLKETAGQFGAVDILVNAAAVFVDGSLEPDVDVYRSVLETNLVAQYAILRTVVGLMKERKSGWIFNIASRAGLYGFSGGGIYGSSKAAFISLTESLYRELAPLGIRATSICPGWVNTEMAKAAGTPLSDAEMIQPEDILNTIRYLLGLSGAACVKEIVLEMRKSIL
jgi:NAD(P)-dependent dehydrogenase (short-subunit alcohol dehydrogenase family)